MLKIGISIATHIYEEILRVRRKLYAI